MKKNSEHVLTDLLEGNARYATAKSQGVDNAALRKETVSGQSPKAYVLSCIDSRVPVETVFDQAIGDIFVGRVAGNVANADQLGSIEYAVCALDVPVLVVMGHQSCGAVKGACNGVELGNLTSLLEKIKPAVSEVSHDTPPTADQLTKIIKANVENTIQYVRDNSPDLASKEAGGDLTIVGAYYHLDSGKVEVLEQPEGASIMA